MKERITKEMLNEIISYGLDKLDNVQEGVDASELHYYLYNEDYFIIGTYQAKEFLDDPFEAIGMIKEWEQDNFGEVGTDFSDPEKVANMIAYIIGEELLSNCSTLQNKWNEVLTADDLEQIKSELESMLA